MSTPSNSTALKPLDQKINVETDVTRRTLEQDGQIYRLLQIWFRLYRELQPDGMTMFTKLDQICAQQPITRQEADKTGTKEANSTIVATALIHNPATSCDTAVTSHNILVNTATVASCHGTAPTVHDTKHQNTQDKPIQLHQEPTQLHQEPTQLHQEQAEGAKVDVATGQDPIQIEGHVSTPQTVQQQSVDDVLNDPRIVARLLSAGWRPPELSSSSPESHPTFKGSAPH